MTLTATQLVVPARDGFELAATLYTPSPTADQGRTVLIAPATGVKRAYYDAYARHLASAGFAALTFDYRGVGGSLPVTLRNFRAQMHEWGEQDIAGAIDWLHQRLPSHRLLAVGHSVGGQLIGIAESNRLLQGLVTVASQSGYWRLWPSPSRYVMWLLWHAVMPALARALSFFPSAALRFGEDLPAGVALEWAAWCRDPQYLAGSLRRPSVAHFQSFRAPILAYGFGDDPLAPRAAVDWLVDQYRSAPRQRRHLAPRELGRTVGHFGFFRPQSKDDLWAESVRWLGER